MFKYAILALVAFGLAGCSKPAPVATEAAPVTTTEAAPATEVTVTPPPAVEGLAVTADPAAEVAR